MQIGQYGKAVGITAVAVGAAIAINHFGNGKVPAVWLTAGVLAVLAGSVWHFSKADTSASAASDTSNSTTKKEE